MVASMFQPDESKIIKTTGNGLPQLCTFSKINLTYWYSKFMSMAFINKDFHRFLECTYFLHGKASGGNLPHSLRNPGLFFLFSIKLKRKLKQFFNS